MNIFQNAQHLPHTRSKEIVTPLGIAGGVGKTTFMIAAIEAYINHGGQPAVFTGDINHNELVRLFNATSFDVRTDGSSYINAAQANALKIFIDTPAAFVDIFNDIFGNVDTVLAAWEMADAMPFFVIPVATNDKCIKTLSRVATLFSDVSGDYRFIFALNEGLMTDKAKLLKDFYAHDFVQAEVAAGRATTVKITTKFTPAFSAILKDQSLRQFIKGDGNLMEKVLAHDFLRKTDDQFTSILKLTSVDNTTPLEKAMGVNVSEQSGLIPPKSKK